MNRSKLIFLFLLYGATIFAWGQSHIDNPVLPRVADAGVMKFNGRYYIGGVFTNGDFYVSNDLVHWEGPVHVFSMNNEWATGFGVKDDQIHANDMHYINGTFHLYWSVNYWSKERNIIHIAHATSDLPLGPYNEPVKDTWMDNRIDPHVFMDDNGKLYMYMVKFTDGNTIWARPMKDPYTFDGEPRYIFASQPGNWETFDNKVEEGPWVIKYRDRYYLMYNSNHTSPEWGNYALGVAESSGPLDFNHGNKYPHPVVKSNQIDLEEQYADLLKYHESGMFHYSFESTEKDWYLPAFDVSSWKKGKAGFGFPVTENATTKKVRTIWKEKQCRIRKDFPYSKTKNGNLSMRILHDGAATVYLNGKIIYENSNGNYLHVDLKGKKELLKEGSNTLAIECNEGHRSNFLDVALFDMKNQVADDILYTPGQPNILRGPNGFEWWLVYMANKNRESRGQYIDRVRFFNKKLTVDGITGKNTPGHHPLPAKPTYQYLKDNNQSPPAVNRVIPSTPASHYFFEAGMRLPDANTPESGIIAWKSDDANGLEIRIDSRSKTWLYVLKENGKEKRNSFPLAQDFRYNVFHTLTIYKNDSEFTVCIDHLPAPGQSVIETGFTGKGLPGICSKDERTEFDGIIYTAGWDEFDNRIRGWNMADNDNNLYVKGDWLDHYEMSVQIDARKEKGIAGVYPIYIDKNNYLSTAFDFSGQQLLISGKSKGKTIETKSISLACLKDHYANMVFSDFMERHFIFETPTTLDAILFKKEAVYRNDTIIENIHEKFHIYYVNDGKWKLLDNFRHTAWEHPGMSRIEFSPIETTELIFVNKSAESENFTMRDLSLQKIWINEIFKQSYNFTVQKEKNNIYLSVDGKPVFQSANHYGPSRVGLFFTDNKFVFNGITLFQKD